MESHPKSNLIRFFEFVNTPIERIEDIIKWAEKVINENEKYYNKKYNWRKDYDYGLPIYSPSKHSSFRHKKRK